MKRLFSTFLKNLVTLGFCRSANWLQGNIPLRCIYFAFVPIIFIEMIPPVNA